MKPWRAHSSLQGGRQCSRTQTRLACLCETAGEKKQKSGVWEMHLRHHGRAVAVKPYFVPGSQ